MVYSHYLGPGLVKRLSPTHFQHFPSLVLKPRADITRNHPNRDVGGPTKGQMYSKYHAMLRGPIDTSDEQFSIDNLYFLTFSMSYNQIRAI